VLIKSYSKKSLKIRMYKIKKKAKIQKFAVPYLFTKGTKSNSVTAVLYSTLPKTIIKYKIYFWSMPEKWVGKMYVSDHL